MDLKEKIKSFPDAPGVYIMKDAGGRVIYIGKAISLKKRVRSYFRKTNGLTQNASDIDYIQTASEEEALLLEAALVKEKQPRYNVMLKDDKRYPLLKFTSDDGKIPKLTIVRKKHDDGAAYFGPYTNARLLRKAVAAMRLIFKISPALPAPQEGYAQIRREIMLFLKGKKKELIEGLTVRMRRLSDEKKFEAAAEIRDRIQALTAVVGAGLKPAPTFFKRIEGFDISDISGKEAVGSMVSFYQGRPDKSNYRRYRIRTVSDIDDYRMIQEVLTRRYKRLTAENMALPDLVIIDGGKGHVGVARGVLDRLGLNKIKVFGIAKREDRVFSAVKEECVSDGLRRLIQAVRDEAHRFAQGYHHVLRRKRIIGK